MEQAVQIVGALLVLTAFAAQLLGYLRADSLRYLLLNLFGAAILAILAMVEEQWGVLPVGERVDRGHGLEPVALLARPTGGRHGPLNAGGCTVVAFGLGSLPREMPLGGSRRSMQGWLAAPIAAWFLAAAPGADAAVSCVFDSDPPGVMDVTMSQTGDFATFTAFASELDLDGNLADAPCNDGSTVPTVDNVGEVHVHDGSPGHVSVTINQPADFAPASQPNPTDPDEVEFDLNFTGSAGDDDLILSGDGTGADSFRAGATGIDVNAGAEPLTFDADITFSGSVPDLTAVLQGGNDAFTGQGVTLFDTPFTRNASLQGGAGNDVITGGSGQDSITGGNDNDTLDGAGGAPGTLSGDAGNDTLESGPGDSSLSGGADSDTVAYAKASGAVEASVDAVGAQATGGSGSDIYTSIENVTGSPFNDQISGDENDNTLDGAGGTGDLLFHDAPPGGVNVNLAMTAPQDTGSAGTDTISGFENLSGSPLDDTLGGTSGDNVITGLGGENTVTYAGAEAAVQVSLLIAGGQNTGGAGIDTLSGFEDLSGGDFGDTLTGDLDTNEINGGDGRTRSTAAPEATTTSTAATARTRQAT